ncbi:hypothetical protein HLB35_15465 [Halomonas sp. TBZ9]|uniref:Tetratricopeptide repeat protein n=1 Tax=Vreelandella azerica TaxID=2732867 RepID=A0A7Y3XAI5_9GAMM|nr:hypothetical protein [Halomonas azerica]NOG32802.1 hypothetical protein [Halomonas azerica]
MNTTAFDWQLPGKIVVIDNNSELLMQEGFDTLMSLGTFAVIAFDPSSRVENPEQLADKEDVQLFRHAVLGNGMATELHACLAPEMTSTLPPLPPEQLPPRERAQARVLAKLPIQTIALDNIEGLESLDWLILADNSDSLAVLENGIRTLEDTLLIQARVVFQPTHHHQPDLMQLSHWASRHGFRFYSLNQYSHYSHFPQEQSLLSDQATELASANALFIPCRERMASLSPGKLNKLSFLLHTIYGMADLTYDVLYQLDPLKAQAYLEAEGLTLAVGEPFFESSFSSSLFSAAQVQWWDTSDMGEEPDYSGEEYETAKTEVEETTAVESDRRSSLSGDITQDIAALQEVYPLAGSPLRESTYVFELLDTIEKEERFVEGYRLIQQASKVGLGTTEQLDTLIYWRKAQISAQQGAWFPSELEFTDTEKGHWFNRGSEAAAVSKSIDEAIRLRREGAFSAAEQWLAGYREQMPACPLSLAEQAKLSVLQGKQVDTETLLVTLRGHEANPQAAIYLAFWLINTQKANKALAVLNRLEINGSEVQLVKAQALMQQKHYDLALQQLEQIPEESDVAAEACLIKATIHHHLKAQSEAIIACIQAIAHRPAYLPSWETLGELTVNIKELYNQNIDLLETVMCHSGGSRRLIQLLVTFYIQHENWPSALQWARQGVSQEPENIDMRMNLLQVLHSLKDWSALRLAARQGVTYHPRKLNFSYYLGVAENGLHNSAKAMQYLKVCHKASPRDNRVCFEYALALTALGRHADALEMVRKIDEGKLSKSSLTTMGQIYTRLGLYDSAEDVIQSLLVKHPADANLHWALSNILLKKGKIGEGWDEYEWGFEAGERNPGREFDVPRWDGKPLDKGKVLVWHEQGLGDEIMFAACLTFLDKPACNIVFQCRERLARLFKKTFGHIEIMPIKENRPLPSLKGKNISAHIPVGSLVRLFHRDSSSFPDYSGYLQCSLTKTSKWRKYLEDEFGNDKIFVGVSWAGGITNLKKAKTYFGTKKENFSPILEVKGVVFVSLMYFNVTDDVSELRDQGVSIHEMPDVDMKNNLEEVSAITKSLDLVIATENFPFIHAGSLGVECWLMSNFDSHIYMDDRNEFKFFRAIKITKIEKPDSRNHVLNISRKLAAQLERRVQEKLSYGDKSS